MEGIPPRSTSRRRRSSICAAFFICSGMEGRKKLGASWGLRAFSVLETTLHPSIPFVQGWREQKPFPFSYSSIPPSYLSYKDSKKNRGETEQKLNRWYAVGRTRNCFYQTI